MAEEGIRINRYLSECGLCSRRAADRLVAAGRVTINGRCAEAGERVGKDDAVSVDGKALNAPEKKVYYRYYKPRGVVCTFESREPNNLAAGLSLPERVTYAGRLDKDSEGLLLLTNDGDLIEHLMHARAGHEKEYEVEVDRPVTDTFLAELEEGVYLPELSVRTRPCRAKRTGERSFRIILTQGLNRQIRRMCEAKGFRVKKLCRLRVGSLRLAGLKKGEVRRLTKEEEREIKGERRA